jgi:hypothetical protein
VGGARIGRCIVVNATETVAASALSVAHQLCHLLLGETPRVCQPDEERDPSEVRASCFATAFLMPRMAIEKYRHDFFGFSWREINPVHVIELRSHFRVSYQAVLSRLRGLDLIDEEHCQYLQRVPEEQLAQVAGQDDTRPLLPPASFERRLRALGLEAFRMGKISRGRLAEILGLDFDELAELLRALGIAQPAIPRRSGRPNPLRNQAG